MQYMMEGLVLFNGAPGGTAYYIIYETDTGYWCKMKSWKQYRGMPAGDFALWKDGKQWKTTGTHPLISDIKDQLVRLIDEWYYASEAYKDECRKTFKYMDDQP
jgi:hypothetical protein